MGEDFAWTIPLIQAGFGVLFLLARRAGAAPEAARWGTAFLLVAGAFAVPALATVLPIRIVAIWADTLFALAFYHFADALILRYRGPVLVRLRLTLLAISIAAPVAAVLWVGKLQAELFASDVTCALQLALALALVPVWPKRWIDRALIALSWLTVADNLIRTASVPFTAAGATFDTFLETDYDYLMQATGLVLSLAGAVLALAAVISDVIAAHLQDALLDPLTQLLNRRGLEAIAGPGREGRPDGIVSCDLDHFKRVNDTFGHAAGDRVLLAFADLIRANLPAGGAGARVGGEEFVLYLPGHSLPQTLVVARQLRLAMAAHDWTKQGIDAPQTASFGLGLRLGNGPGEALAEAIARADAQLYEAKRGGRDQIHELVAA